MSEWNYDVSRAERGYSWVSIRASGGRTLVRLDVFADGKWWYFDEQVYAHCSSRRPEPKAPAPLPERIRSDSF